MTRKNPVASLTKLQMAFIRAYVELDDIERAAQTVFPRMSRQDAMKRAWKMRRNKTIAGEIERARAAMVTELGWGKAEVMRRLQRMVDFDPACLVADDGVTRKRLVDLDEDTRRTIIVDEMQLLPDGTIIITKLGTAKADAMKLLTKAVGLLDRAGTESHAVYNIDLNFNGETPPKDVQAKVVRHVLDIQTSADG